MGEMNELIMSALGYLTGAVWILVTLIAFARSSGAASRAHLSGEMRDQAACGNRVERSG
jgi:hypothetical protein